MSNRDETDEATFDDPTAPVHDEPTEAEQPAAPKPSTPASRARRIGGRPLPGKPAATTDTAPTDTAPTDTAPTDTATTDTTTTALKQPSTSPKPARRVTDTSADDTAAAPEKKKKKDKKPKPPRDAEATLRRLRWLPAGVLGVAAVVLAVLCITLGHGVWWAKKSVSSERDQVLAAAKTCVGSITNYDYRKLAASEQAGLACTTGTFQSQYKQAMDTVVAKLAPQTKTVQTFQVADAGIESVSANGDQWVVLVYGQQAVTNAQTGPSTPRLDVLSARVTLNNVGGQWRVVELKRL